MSLLSVFAEEGFSSFAALPGWERLAELLLEWNGRMNLTAITGKEEIYRKHFADSLTAAEFLPNGATLLDVGCGGGFPTLPLALARPDLRVTALDSTAKKLRFVEAAAKELSLPVVTLCGRAEELGKGAPYRECFDCVTARAVARLPVLCEWCLPFVRVGGAFVALKGAAGEEELREAENAVALLGGKVETVRRRTVGGESRVILVIRKIAPTPAKYPRNGGQIMKKPL